MLISNIFNLLDFSLKYDWPNVLNEKQKQGKQKVEPRKKKRDSRQLEEKNNRIKNLLIIFLENPNCDNIYEIIISIGDTILSHSDETSLGKEEKLNEELKTLFNDTNFIRSDENQKKNLEIKKRTKLKKLAVKQLKKRYLNFKDLTNLNKYKNNKQIEVILLLYLVIHNRIKKSSFNFEKILKESSPLS